MGPELGDKTLAEFIIDLSADHATPQSFAAALEANGAELPLAFCTTLLSLINHMRPGKAASAGVAPPSAERAAKYPGLALPNSTEQVRKMTAELTAGAREPSSSNRRVRPPFCAQSWRQLSLHVGL